jgi:hypothetical protein
MQNARPSETLCATIGSFGHWLVGDVEGNAEFLAGYNNFNFSPNDLAGGTIDLTPVGIIIQGIEDLISFFDWLFGSDNPPPIPRQLRHARHPLYRVILGVPDGVIPDLVSAGKPEFCGDPQPCPNARPLSKDPARSSTPTQPNASSDCQRNVDNAEAACGILQGFFGIDVHVICPVAVGSCYSLPTPYTCGMALGTCGSAGLLDYWCYREITNAKAGCK